MTKPIVLVEVRNRYGVDYIYPMNEAAKLFARISKTATLSEETCGRIQSLGFDIQELFTPKFGESK